MTYYSENIKLEKPRIEIEYCSKCKWLLRAAWMAQELLSTFSNEVREMALIPSETKGIFEIRCGRDVIWDRDAKKGFPEIKQLKRLVRDKLTPGKDLGHIDQ